MSVSLQGWWEYQGVQLHLVDFLHHASIIQGQLEVTQEYQVMGPWVEHRQMHNSPNTREHNMAQPGQYSQAWNSPQTCEDNTSQPDRNT